MSAPASCAALGAIIARNRHRQAAATAPTAATVRARGRLPRRGRRTDATSGSSATRTPGPASSAWAPLAEPEILGSRAHGASGRRGPALQLRPDREPAARRSSCRRAAASSLRFLDGYAADENVAAATDRRAMLGLPTPEPGAARGRVRPQPHARQQPAPAGDATPALPFLAPTAPSWSITGTTPRPWAHVLANPLGHGAVHSQ